MVRPSPRPSAAVSGPAPLRNVAGSARWRRGRAAGPRLLGGGDCGSALGVRRLKDETSPTCSWTRGGGGRSGGPSWWFVGGRRMVSKNRRELQSRRSCRGGGGEKAAPCSAGGGECRNTFMGVLGCLLSPKDRPGPRKIPPSPAISSSPPCRVAPSRLWAGFFCPRLT